MDAGAVVAGLPLADWRPAVERTETRANQRVLRQAASQTPRVRRQGEMSAARPLRIGLDISSAFARNSGISFYGENLVTGLAEVNKTDEFFSKPCLEGAE